MRNERCQEKVHVPVDILLIDNDADLCHCGVCVCVNELRRAQVYSPKILSVYKRVVYIILYYLEVYILHN